MVETCGYNGGIWTPFVFPNSNFKDTLPFIPLSFTTSTELLQEPRGKLNVKLKFRYARRRRCSVCGDSDCNSHSDSDSEEYYDHHESSIRCEVTLVFDNNAHLLSKTCIYEVTFKAYTTDSFHELITSYQFPRKSTIITLNSLKSLLKFKDLLNVTHICGGVRRDDSKEITDRENDAASTNIGLMMLESANYSDISLVVGKKTFPAHKHVLSLESEVFKAMFSHDMAENKSGTLIIKDLDPDVIEDLLHYIYTGKTKNEMQEIPIKLFEAANKYTINKLILKCVDNFLFYMNEQSIVEILKISDFYKIQELKTATTTFQNKHIEKLLKQDNYIEYLCNNLRLDTIVHTLKLCSKYKPNKLKLEAFKFLEHHEEFVNNKLMGLLDSHPEIKVELAKFLQKSDVEGSNSAVVKKEMKRVGRKRKRVWNKRKRVTRS